MSQFDLFGEPGDAAREAAQARPAISLRELAREAASCTRCPLYRDASQTVFGEGPRDARLLFVGEQPGDQEDREGRPFVGPAGRLFDRALEEAGIDRAEAYVTNAVKHFKFVRRGPRRIHQKPERSEIEACHVWLEQEIAAVAPEIVVALGATAGRAVLGREVRVMKERGHFMEDKRGFRAFLTVHPSFLLRVPDEEAKRAEYERFIGDLRKLAA